MPGLPVSRVVDVQVSLAALQAQAPTIDSLLLIGTSTVIDTVERMRTYATIDEVATDFGTAAPEYLAALLWFGQNPQPETLNIGRWVKSASNGQLIGGGVLAADLLPSAWTGITAGAFFVMIDGIPLALSGMNFSATTNLNGVASIIQTAVRAATSQLQTVVYNFTYNNFILTDAITGASSVIGFAQPPTAKGSILFAVTPSNSDTVTIAGTVVTFVTGAPVGNQVQIVAGNLSATLTALASFLNGASDLGLALMNYSVVGGTTLYCVSKVTGTAVGNYYTLAASVATPSGLTLTGGAVVAAGSITFTVNPTANDTITLDGTAVTFVSGTPVGNQVHIAGSLAGTLINLLTFLNASADANIVLMSYAVTGTTLYVTSKLPGTPGNAYTLAASAASASAGTLSGGTGTNISGMLSWLSTSSGAYVAPGLAAESAVSALTLFDSMFSTQFYGLVVIGATDADHQAIAAYVEAASPPHYYGITTSEAGVLVPGDTSDIAYVLKLLKYNKTAVQYSSTNPYAIMSYLARILTTAWLGANTTITLKFKVEPGIVAETLNTTQANACEAKNCNVYVNYNTSNDIAFVEQGVSSSGQFTDTVIGADWLAGNVQTRVFDVLQGSPTKIPQTDAGMGILINAAEAACIDGVTNAFLAPGIWFSTGVGSVAFGDNLPKGYYVWAPLMATQSEAVRQTRAAPVMTILAKTAGAIHSSLILLDVLQ